MRQYIILSQADIITLRKNQPVSVCVNDVKYIMCSDECYEQERGSMSDTVKLIIEIPRDLHEDLKSGKIYYSLCEAPQGLVEGIRNGTPLDDVKAEIIDKAVKDVNGEGFIFLGRLLRIFDNIGKESEDKE